MRCRCCWWSNNNPRNLIRHGRGRSPARTANLFSEYGVAVDASSHPEAIDVMRGQRRRIDYYYGTKITKSCVMNFPVALPRRRRRGLHHRYLPYSGDSGDDAAGGGPKFNLESPCNTAQMFYVERCILRLIAFILNGSLSFSGKRDRWSIRYHDVRIPLTELTKIFGKWWLEISRCFYLTFLPSSLSLINMLCLELSTASDHMNLKLLANNKQIVVGSERGVLPCCEITIRSQF